MYVPKIYMFSAMLIWNKSLGLLALKLLSVESLLAFSVLIFQQLCQENNHSQDTCHSIRSVKLPPLNVKNCLQSKVINVMSCVFCFKVFTSSFMSCCLWKSIKRMFAVSAVSCTLYQSLVSEIVIQKKFIIKFGWNESDRTDIMSLLQSN